jgi:hypothetical protein
MIVPSMHETATTGYCGADICMDCAIKDGRIIS